MADGGVGEAALITAAAEGGGAAAAGAGAAGAAGMGAGAAGAAAAAGGLGGIGALGSGLTMAGADAATIAAVNGGVGAATLGGVGSGLTAAELGAMTAPTMYTAAGTAAVPEAATMGGAMFEPASAAYMGDAVAPTMTETAVANPAMGQVANPAVDMFPNETAQLAMHQAPASEVAFGAPAQNPGIMGNLGGYMAKNPMLALSGASMLSNMMGGKKGSSKEKYKGALSKFKYDPSTYKASTAVSPTFRMSDGGIASLRDRRYAEGGITSLGGYSAGGNPRLLEGPGDGMSDDIPATIEDKQPARLATGEYVISADVVSGLGNGSTDAGARELDRMMTRIRRARTGNPKQGKKIDPNKYFPE